MLTLGRRWLGRQQRIGTAIALAVQWFEPFAGEELPSRRGGKGCDFESHPLAALGQGRLLNPELIIKSLSKAYHLPLSDVTFVLQTAAHLPHSLCALSNPSPSPHQQPWLGSRLYPVLRPTWYKTPASSYPLLSTPPPTPPVPGALVSWCRL